MTQDEKWQAKYDEVMDFIKTNKRNPSKHRIEEHNMLNWLKASRKVLNAGKMKPERVKMFEELQELMEEYKRVNQYQ
ncbi:MAG: helicase associated domain-containing protein [Butyrivibrio sp.]|nr:helicase associated domain-containing protein [Butyrivibrio sp.]